MDPTMDHLGLVLWVYIKYSIICLMRIPDMRSQPREGFGTVRRSIRAKRQPDVRPCEAVP